MLRAARVLVAPPAPKLRREQRIHPMVLREFLGSPRWRRWKQLLAAADVEPLRHRRLTHAEARRVMEVWYRDLGAFRMKRWRG